MRKIIHVDMDYFFAQVEEQSRPELRDMPFAVGGSYTGKGVICTSNYVARDYGVRSAMSSFEALKLCPHLIFISPNLETYRKSSQTIFEIFRNYTDKVQGISLDEAYLDVSDCPLFHNDAVKIAKAIKLEIFAITGLTASAGVSSNKLLAKIGSELFKPDGLAVLRPKGIEEKIKHFPIKKISGIGKVTAQKMHNLGIYTFGDLQRYSLAELSNLYGDFGCTLFQYCRGLDNRDVNPHRTRKSVSIENTFLKNLETEDEFESNLAQAYELLIIRLKKYEDREIKNIFVKIKFHDFECTTVEAKRDLKLKNFTEIFYMRWEKRKEPLRLLGMGVKFKCERLVADQLEFTF